MHLKSFLAAVCFHQINNLSCFLLPTPMGHLSNFGNLINLSEIQIDKIEVKVRRDQAWDL